MTRGPRIAAVLGAVALAWTAAASGPAEAAFKLGVTYTGGSVVSGPITSDLGGALPASVDATFGLGAGTQGSEPPIRLFSTGDVTSANISFGDGTWTLAQLNNFSMKVIAGTITELVYGFDPITTAAVADRPVLNFPLTITGTDRASGQAFEYRYANSTQTLTAIPEPASLALVLIGLASMAFVARRPHRTRAVNALGGQVLHYGVTLWGHTLWGQVLNFALWGQVLNFEFSRTGRLST